MRNESNASSVSLIRPQPLPECSQEFSARVSGLLDGRAKDEETVEKALEGMDSTLDAIAIRMYNLASMLVGEGEDGIRLVETTVEKVDISVCDNPDATRRNSRRTLAAAALELIAERDGDALAAPEGIELSGSCIEDDDLAVSVVDLERMFAGPDRDRVREWLERLPADVRTVFVLRAVADFPAAEAAELLVGHGGPKAAGWNADGVRTIFRQGLCSLASQLIQAAKG
jgi:hypothetical protein